MPKYKNKSYWDAYVNNRLKMVGLEIVVYIHIFMSLCVDASTSSMNTPKTKVKSKEWVSDKNVYSYSILDSCRKFSSTIPKPNVVAKYG